jgi:hypothetical protein
MESDWEVELGPDAPVIDALWPGLIDLRSAPKRIAEIEETRRLPALAEVLLRLNCADSGTDSSSPVWTSKCDLWELSSGPDLDLSSGRWDPDEMDATAAESAAVACYIDLLPVDAVVFAGLDRAQAWASTIAGRLRETVGRCCRVDLVIRRAFQGDMEGLGVTAYATACGADSAAAERALSRALLGLANAICAPTSPASKIGEALQ